VRFKLLLLKNKAISEDFPEKSFSFQEKSVKIRRESLVV
jgi:hypothetical protein